MFKQLLTRLVLMHTIKVNNQYIKETNECIYSALNELVANNQIRNFLKTSYDGARHNFKYDDSFNFMTVTIFNTSIENDWKRISLTIPHKSFIEGSLFLSPDLNNHPHLKKLFKLNSTYIENDFIFCNLTIF